MAGGKWIGPFDLIFKSGLNENDQRTNWPTLYIVMNQLPKDNDGRVMVSMANQSLTELRGDVEILKANLEAILQQAEDLFRAPNSN
jgi:hypothetical protein